ncbi:MAG: hypothetical protein R6T90_04110 [Dissulfuribacterales bacterium]
MKNSNANALYKVMRDFPYLCSWGLANKPLLKFYGHNLADLRKSLRNRFEEFQLCCEWLSMCEARKTINYKKEGSSYYLKHVVKGWAGKYISNGVFIAAVIHCGLPYRGYDHSVNVHVGLSSRSQPIKASRNQLIF